MTAYEGFIDDMVELANRNVSANRIRSQSHAERINHDALPLDPPEQERKELLLSLAPQQREIVAKMLIAERQEAVHDVLAQLEWAVTTGRLKMMADEESFADQIDVSMQGDFMARLIPDDTTRR